MDTFIKALSSNNTKTTANLSEAIALVKNDLLRGNFDLKEITRLATELNNGPVPYSTHDLATSVTLGLLRNVPMQARTRLAEVQMMARLTVATWAREGKVVPLLAEAFEHTLYKDYHPDNFSESTTFPEGYDYAIRTKIARLVQSCLADRSVDPRELSQPNCAVVLTSSGNVSLRWLSASSDDEMDRDMVSFALLGGLSSYKKLLHTCVQEAKAGTLGDAFFYGPADTLFQELGIEVLREMKRFRDQIRTQRPAPDTGP